MVKITHIIIHIIIFFILYFIVSTILLPTANRRVGYNVVDKTNKLKDKFNNNITNYITKQNVTTEHESDILSSKLYATAIVSGIFATIYITYLCFLFRLIYRRLWIIIANWFRIPTIAPRWLRD